jgi:hypothetical protein
VDDHAKRVCQPLIDAWDDFGRGHASVLDLSRLAQQASDALDNSSAPLPQLLAKAASDLEFAYFATEPNNHDEEARRILSTAFSAMDRAL